MPRIIAVCLGVFGLANAIAGLFSATLDANLWWIDLRCLPDGFARVSLVVACGVLIAYGLFPEMTPARRIASLGVVGAMALACLANGAMYYALLYRGSIHSGWPLPISAMTAVSMIWILRDIVRDQPQALNWRVAVPALCLCLIGFPLAQIFLFGKTDYRRQADAAIVFGARVYADGRPSTALYDRVRTACELYNDHTVSVLIFSGGPGDGTFHETDVMQSLALKWGVNPEDIWIDRDGLNTRATLERMNQWVEQFSLRPSDFIQPKRPRFLAVSHFYHLPRIKLESQRLGLDILTVPAKESYTLTKMPVLIAREVAALWSYYLRPPV